MNVLKLTAIGAAAAFSLEAQATVTMVAEYDTLMGPSGESTPTANTMVSVSVTDILTEDISQSAINEGMNSGIVYTIAPTMGDDEAIRTLTIPKPLQGNYYVEYLNGSSEGIGLGMTFNEGDNLFLVFQNATFSFSEGKVLEMAVYNSDNRGVADLEFNQNLDIQTQSTYVAYSNGERAWDGDWNTITSSQGYVQESINQIPTTGPNTGSDSGTFIPEPSSVLFITMATLPLVFRRKRA